MGYLYSLIHTEVNESEDPIAMELPPARMLLMMCKEEGKYAKMEVESGEGVT